MDMRDTIEQIEIILAKRNASIVRGDKVKTLDWDMVVEIIKERKAIDVDAGLKEDWFFTASTIMKDGKIIVDCDPYISSIWATPTLYITDENGDSYNVECWRYLEGDIDKAEHHWTMSALAKMEEAGYGI